MIRAVTAATVAVCLAGVTVPVQAAPGPGEGSAQAPQARGRIIINSVTYDPSGSDTGRNAHVNREVVKITNNTNQRRSLTRWTLRDEGSIHVYRFPRTRLKPGRTVTVHTGKGRDRGLQQYWGQGFYVWNNDGDKATLRSRGGRVIDTCSWGDGGGRTGC